MPRVRHRGALTYAYAKKAAVVFMKYLVILVTLRKLEWAHGINDRSGRPDSYAQYCIDRQSGNTTPSLGPTKYSNPEDLIFFNPNPTPKSRCL